MTREKKIILVFPSDIFRHYDLILNKSLIVNPHLSYFLDHRMIIVLDLEILNLTDPQLIVRCLNYCCIPCLDVELTSEMFAQSMQRLSSEHMLAM